MIIISNEWKRVTLHSLGRVSVHMAGSAAIRSLGKISQIIRALLDEKSVWIVQ